MTVRGVLPSACAIYEAGVICLPVLHAKDEYIMVLVDLKIKDLKTYNRSMVLATQVSMVR